MTKYLKSIIAYILIFQFSVAAFAEEASPDKGKVNLKDLVLPSETEGLRKEAGAIYYSSSTKGKVLIPVHVWGEVNKSGLHYVPMDTDVVRALSLAGGPKSTADLSKVHLTRIVDSKYKEVNFDLSEGGGVQALNEKLTSGDTIFVEKNYFYENRTYYTSLIGIAATLMTAFILYQRLQKEK